MYLAICILGIKFACIIINQLMQAETKGKTTKPTVATPTIAVAKVDEFDAVPAYIRGRTTREQLNEAIVSLNAVISAKYTTLATPRGSLGGNALKKFNALRDEETDDTKHVHFFTEESIKLTSDVKVDTGMRACIAILRALGRVKEHRAGGLVRYVLQ